MDLATRERGYGLIKKGIYDMKLTPVGSPAPPCPDDADYKPALGCWLWNPEYGELRLETNAMIFREAITGIWNKARFEPQAAEGLLPVVRFIDRIAVPVKAVDKVFSGPVIRVVGWVERSAIPGWADRAPTVAPPKPLPVLSAATAPAIDTPVKKSAKAKTKTKVKPAASDDPNDPIDDILGNDPIPY